MTKTAHEIRLLENEKSSMLLAKIVVPVSFCISVCCFILLAVEWKSKKYFSDTAELLTIFSLFFCVFGVLASIAYFKHKSIYTSMLKATQN